MILDDQHDQLHRSFAGAAWAKTVHIAEILFFTGVLILCGHLLAALAAIGHLYSPPNWLWTELKMLVYPFTPILALRLLSIVSLYRLSSSQRVHYFYVATASGIALILVINLSAASANLGLPLLSIAYLAQWVLDAQLSPKAQKKQHNRLAHCISTATRKKRHTQSTQKQKAYTPQQHIARTFQSTEDSSVRCTSMRFPQQGTTESFRPEGQSVYYNTSSPFLSQQVVILHSPVDKKFAGLLRTHLQPKIRQGIIKLWDASQIQPGAVWKEERARAIQSAAVAVLLVSPEFMGCDLVACHELPLLLYQAQGRQTLILILHVSPCDLTGSGLEKFYPLNVPDKPLAKLERADRDKILSESTHIICQRLGIFL